MLEIDYSPQLATATWSYASGNLFVTGRFAHVTPLNPQSVEVATVRHLSHLVYGLHSPSLQTSGCGATLPLEHLGKKRKQKDQKLRPLLITQEL